MLDRSPGVQSQAPPGEAALGNEKRRQEFGEEVSGEE